MVAPSKTARVRFACNACGAVSPKWEGKCPGCGEWNSLVEEVERTVIGRHRLPAGPGAVATRLSAVETGDASRRGSGMAEVDRVLGGGLVAGSLVLLGGDPGIGKSTLALQLAGSVGTDSSPTLYCAGEESPAQLSLRARRLGCADAAIEVIAETDLDIICATIEARRPAMAIVDSIQTVFDITIPGVPGSPSQVREAVGRLMVCAKSTGVAIILIGHVTKEGAIAGPRTLEHMVDVVLYLEGDRHGEQRLLRGLKNRFGATGELGLFSMEDDGMREITAVGRAFLDPATLGIAGTALTVLCEGTRALVVEVQALTADSSFGLPRRTASGFDLGRLHLLLAVLEKRGKVVVAKSDVYVNAVGGVRLTEPATDLAVALAIASAHKGRPIPEGMVILGEVGLGGEIRRVRRLEARLNEAAAIGLDRALIPAGHTGSVPAGLRCERAATLKEALAKLG